nr:MAG: replication associated protein [Cressdnaviricota sp.]
MASDKSVPTVPSEDGNTKHPHPAKNWCFTFNNYSKDDIQLLCAKFKETCNKFCFQEEKGASGTPHLQGMIELKIKLRPNGLDLPKSIHWEKPRNVKACWEYVQKEETRNGEIYSMGLPKPKIIKIAKPIKIIENLRPWQYHVEQILLSEPDGRTLHWITDLHGGIGKSAFSKYMYVKHNTLVIQGGKLSDIMNIIFNTDMDTVNAIIIDVPRNNGNKISYSSVECILNGMITNVKYETGVKVFNPPIVLVFANEEPDITKLSEDRWNIINIQTFETLM